MATGPFRRHLMPLIDSWGYPFEFPESFDHVGTQDVTSWLAATTSFEAIEARYGWDRFRNYTAGLAGYGQHVVQEAFTALAGEAAPVDVGMEVGPLRLVRLPDGLLAAPESSRQVRTRLASELNFETAITTFDGVGYLRLSAHLYNTPGDYEAFAERAVPAMVGWAAGK